MIKTTSKGGRIESIQATGADANELFRAITSKSEPVDVSEAPKPRLTIDDLTDRQFDTLCLVGGGRSNSEIAFELKVSESTAKFHVQELFKIFKVNCRVSLVVEALRLKVVALTDYPTVNAE